MHEAESAQGGEAFDQPLSTDLRPRQYQNCMTALVTKNFEVYIQEKGHGFGYIRLQSPKPTYPTGGLFGMSKSGSSEAPIMCQVAIK